MPTVDVNGVTLHYERRGAGEPILFVMGLGGQLVDWPEDFLDLFVERGFETIVFDNRDVGLSSQTEWQPPSRWKQLRSMLTRRPVRGVGYTLTDMADDAAGLLAALDVGAVHVVGISMGGMIAQELAIEHAARIRSVCSIMSNTGDRRSGGIKGRLLTQLARSEPPSRDGAVDASVALFELVSGPHFEPARVREMAERSIERSFTPDGVARQSAAIMGSRDRTDLLAGVTAPTLVIHGQVDPLVKLSGGLATTAAIPDSRLLVYPDMGHDLPRPRWGEFADAIVGNARRAVATNAA